MYDRADVDYNTPRQTSASISSRTTSRCRRRSARSVSKFRQSSPSERSIITTTTLDDVKSSAKSTGYSQHSIPLLSLNGKSLDNCATSRASSRVMSGVSYMTLTGSGRRSTMTSSTARSSAIGPCVSFPEHIGSCPGLTVWTIENAYLRQVLDSDHGFFHQGNVYLILKVGADGSSSLHVWCGSLSNETDKNAMQMYSHRLDRIIDGANIFSLENQGFETQTFLRHFKSGLIVVEGKSRNLLSRTWKYTQRLYLVRSRQIPTATCMKCSLSALAPDRALILDGFPRMYVWLGPETDSNTRVKAIQVATAIRARQRKGLAHIIVIEKSNTSLHEAFIQKLDNDENVVDEDPMLSESTESNQDYLHLYRINGERVMYDMPYVTKKPLQHKYLTSKDCFLMDQGPKHPVFVWVGSTADTDTLHNAMQRAQNFTNHHNYPTTTPICRLMEGFEPLSFKTVFNNWADRLIKDRQLVRTYNVANIGRALYSRSDCRTISQMTECWSDDEFVKNSGKTEVWRIDRQNLTPLVWEQRGLFYDSQCYIVLHKESSVDREINILYYWLGCKSSDEEKCVALKIAFAMSSTLQHQTFIMRILDGKEPKHFMTVLQDSMVVFDSDLNEDDEHSSVRGVPSFISSAGDNRCEIGEDVKMFCIQEFIPGCMRVLQVPPRTSSLNSSAAFVVFNGCKALVWYGKNSTASEREYSKNMLSYFCPDKSHQFDIVNEKKEPSKFYEFITEDGLYPTEFKKQVIHRRPPRLALYSESEQTFSFYDEFSQQDLNEKDIFILDTFDQLQTWCGRSTLERSYLSLSTIVQIYLDQDLAGRCQDDIHICFVIQGSEPDIFVKYFFEWDEYGYGGHIAFEAARKRTRQENASINIDAQMVDLTYMNTTKASYKELVKDIDIGDNINQQHKEHHLTDKEFTRALHMTRAQFYRLPQWKQQQILKSAKLTGSHPAPVKSHSDCKEQSQISVDLLKFVKSCNKVA